MKIRKSQFTVRKIGIMLPILAYYLFYGIYTIVLPLSMKIYSAESYLFASQTLPYLSLLSLTYSYFCCHIYTKKKVWGFVSYTFLLIIVSLFYYLISNKNWGVTIWGIFHYLYTSISGILLYIVYDWFQRKQKQKELERRNLQSELKLLKNQLNPHFLFNTLNNIDSLIFSNPEMASKSLVQMSEMMRYMIYETNVPEVALTQELKYIRNYLDLQRLQYDNPNLVSFTLEGIPDKICVAPMLFIAFIENAFKHCTDKKTTNTIQLLFQIQESKIHFEISNLFDPTKQINKDSSSGIGLSIIKRRLDILYPHRYYLQMNQKNGYFDVSLTIKLT